jgi:glyceraldehyde 3-phosphate dehydrogenase
VVIESTGVFTEKDKASAHLEAGAKYVIISAPAKGDEAVKTFVLGVNEETFDPGVDKVISMASCTTNALTPVAKVLNDVFGIEKAMMSTIHSYTMDQVLQDSPHKDLRRARAASQSIIPTTTGATKAVAEVIPDLKGKMDGVSFRVPTPTVSLVDFVAVLKNDATVEEINKAFSDAVQEPRFHGALAVCDQPLVSVDFRGNPNGSIVDLLSTQVIGGNLVKVIAWYDNELGYSYRLAEFCRFIETKISQ